MTDKIKLGVAGLLVALGLWGYYWLAESALILRVLAVVAGIAAGATVAWFSCPVTSRPRLCWNCSREVSLPRPQMPSGLPE